VEFTAASIKITICWDATTVILIRSEVPMLVNTTDTVFLGCDAVYFGRSLHGLRRREAVYSYKESGKLLSHYSAAHPRSK
jgi:hypothetical protein